MIAESRHSAVDCQRVGSLLDGFLDGELPQQLAFEVEQALGECPACRERLQFEHALRASLKRAVSADALITSEFRARLTRVAEKETRRSQVAAGWKSVRTSHWALSAAAVVVGVGISWSWKRFDGAALANQTITRVIAAKQDLPLGGEPGAADPSLRIGEHATTPVKFEPFASTRTALNSGALGLPSSAEQRALPTLAAAAANLPQADDDEAKLAERLLDRLIDLHSAPPRPEFTHNTDLETQVERQLGVRARLPALERYGAVWRSGSVVRVGNKERAASLRYALSKHKMTVYVYDPRSVSVQPTLGRRVEGDFPLYVGYRRGYSVAAFERRGVGYTLATDLDDGKVTEIAKRFP